MHIHGNQCALNPTDATSTKIRMPNQAWTWCHTIGKHMVVNGWLVCWVVGIQLHQNVNLENPSTSSNAPINVWIWYRHGSRGAIALMHIINNHNHYLILCVSNVFFLKKLQMNFFYTMLFSIYLYTCPKTFKWI